MLDVKVDRGDPTDLYEQVAGEIRRAIAEGEATPGERLPPAKDLAAVSQAYHMTVHRLEGERRFHVALEESGKVADVCTTVSKRPGRRG